MKESLGQKPKPFNPFLEPAVAYQGAKEGLELTKDPRGQLLQTLLEEPDPRLPLLGLP